MIIGTVAVTRSMVLAALAAAAFLLAFVGIFASLVSALQHRAFWRSGFLFPGATIFLPSFQHSLCSSQLTGYFGLRSWVRFIFRSQGADEDL